jgi:hypothetical protein
MSEFLFQVVKGTPLWVWAILVALIVLGVQQMRPRSVKRHVVLIAPVVFLVIGVLSAGRSTLGFVSWAVTIGVVGAFTALVWKPIGNARFDTATDRLLLPASVIPIIIMLSIFLLNYVIAVTLAIHPDYREILAWQLCPALLLGALSGVFMGRAATLFRLGRSSAALQPVRG